MERQKIVEHLGKKRKIVILTFLLLFLAFAENWYLNCYRDQISPWCEMGWIYVILALILASVTYYYRK